MATTSAPAPLSRVPNHLRPFHKPAFIVEPLQTQSPYSYIPPSKKSDELCPRCWRLPSKVSKRVRLKALVTKTSLDHFRYQQVRRPFNSEPCATIMRMKDSDDYITVRAPNPWTGAITPSDGSPCPSPRRSSTVESTQGALNARRVQTTPSPTAAEACPRPSFVADNNKVSAASLHRWQARLNGWTSDLLPAASPRETDIVPGAVLSKTRPHLRDDEFVLRMPSAEEPQLFAHPSWSSAQIDAFGRRIGPVQAASHNTTMLTDNSMNPHTVATFAPFSSPHTPDLRPTVAKPALMKTVRLPSTFRNITPLAELIQVRRKPVGSSPALSTAATRGSSLEPPALKDTYERMGGMSFPSPELHAVSSNPASWSGVLNERQRLQSSQSSLGCPRAAVSGECTMQPDESDVPLNHRLLNTLENMYSPATRPSSGQVDTIKAQRQMQHPAGLALRYLRDKAPTTGEVIVIACYTVSVFIALSMIWRLAVVLQILLEILLWPLKVPWAMVAWLLV